MISFSGIDCGGKSTQIEKVKLAYEAKNKKVKVIHSRGGYTPMLEWFKTLIRSDKGGSAQDHAQYREAVHGNPKKRKLLLWLSIFDLGLYYGVYFRLVELFGTTASEVTWTLSDPSVADIYYSDATCLYLYGILKSSFCKYLLSN